MAVDIYKDMKRDLKRAGYEVKMQGNGHYRVTDPHDKDKFLGTFAATPSDHRTVKNDMATLKRNGCDPNRTPPRKAMRKAMERKTIKSRPEEVIDLAMRQQQINAALIADQLKISTTNANMLLSKLYNKGLLKRIDRGVYCYPSEIKSTKTTTTVEVMDLSISPGVEPKIIPAPVTGAIMEILATNTDGRLVLRDEDGNVFIATALSALVLPPA